MNFSSCKLDKWINRSCFAKLIGEDAEGESSRHVMGFLCDVYDATSGILLVHGNFYMAEGCV